MMKTDRSAVCRNASAAALLLALLAAAGGASAAPSAPPCSPTGDVGVDVRPSAYVLDYHFTGASSNSWNDAGSWSWGSWAEEAAAAALVPAVREIFCLTSSGDTVGPFTSYPRVIIDAGSAALIDGPISPIGELVIEPGASVFLIVSLSQFLSDFGNADIGKTAEIDGLLIVGAARSMPLPGASIGTNGALRLGLGATVTADPSAVFGGDGEIELLGGTIEVTDAVTFDVNLMAMDEKNEIRGLPSTPPLVVTLSDYAYVDTDATLELGIAVDSVEIRNLFTVNGQLFLRATETFVLPDFGTLVAATPSGRITTKQGSSNPAVTLTNGRNVFVQSGATLAITGTPGPFDPADVHFVTLSQAVLAIQPQGLLTLENPPTASVPNISNWGRLDLGGRIQGNLTNLGTLRPGVPGSSPGLGRISGDLTLWFTSVLRIDIDGIAPQTEYDQLEVGGVVELDGTLEIDRAPAFSPAPGDSFLILAADAVSGTFTTINGANGLPIVYDPDRVYLGADPDEFDTSSWQRPVVGATVREAETRFCVDDEGLHFDILFGMAETYDLIILRLATDTPSAFSNPSESVALNYYTASDVPDDRLPLPIVSTNNPYTGLDRLVDGDLLEPDTRLTDIRNGFFRFRGTAPHGTQRFFGGDVIGSLALRASQVPPDPQAGVSYNSRTNIYTDTFIPGLLTVEEMQVCTVPEPSMALMGVVAIAALAMLRRRTGGSPRENPSPRAPGDRSR